jgi:hypothetical protein
MRILLHNHNSNRNRRNRNSSHRKHSHKDHNRHRLILHISITRRHMGNHLNRIILSMRISLLIRTFRLNISLYLDHQVGLIPQAILSAVLLHLIPAVDLVHHLRRPHLISRRRHLISRSHLHPRYKALQRTAYSSYRHKKHLQHHRVGSDCHRILVNLLHHNMRHLINLISLY